MKVIHCLQLFLASLLIGLAATTSFADPSAAGKRILVIKSRDIAFYNSTLDGFVAGLQASGAYSTDTTDLKIISLTGDNASDQQVVVSQLAKKNVLIFALGTDASLAVKNAGTSTPCLFSMILDPVSLGLVKNLSQPGSSFTGTTLLVDPGKQLDALQQVDPKVKRVGVLYTDGDATSLAFLSLASQEASVLGIQIVSTPIKDYSSNGKQALQSLASKVDAFWLIVDPASAGAQEVSDTLDVAKKVNLPVIGMSNSNVRSGALLSLSANLRDLGEVDADMAGLILNGTSTPDQIPVRGPRQTILSLNLVAAKELGMTIPPSILHLADEVIDGSESPSGN